MHRTARQVARITATNLESGETVDIVVVHQPGPQYMVHVVAGNLSDGSDNYTTHNVHLAMQRAADEARTYIVSLD
jgi:hypothetical protein